MKSTFTVLFIIQKGKPKADGRVPIMARITINGKMSHFSTKFDILPERWLPKECKTLGQTPDEKIINKSLDALMVLVKSRYNDMTRIGETLTADKLKNSVMGLDSTDPFLNHKLHFEAVDRGYLTQSEINSMLERKFDSQRLELVRDMFLFCLHIIFSLKKLPPTNLLQLVGGRCQ